MAHKIIVILPLVYLGCSSPDTTPPVTSQGTTDTHLQEDDAAHDPRAQSVDSGPEAAPDVGEPDLPAPDWTCLSGLTEPVASPQAVVVGGEVVAFGSGDPIAGAQVRFCARDDLSCSAPLATAISSPEGEFSLSAPALLDGGYFEVTSAGLVATLHSRRFHTTEGTVAPSILVVPTPAQLDAWSAGLEAPVQPERGHVLALALDCGGQPAHGVVLDAAAFHYGQQGSDVETSSAYVQTDLPTPGLEVTSADAMRLWINMPVGPHEIRCKLVDAEGEVCGRSGAFVRAGWLTVAQVEPTLLINDFGCVGEELPVPDSVEQILSLGVTDALNKDAIAKLPVKACGMGDPDCLAPFDEQITDEDGRVSLTVPTLDRGFEGFVYAELPGVIPPTLFHILAPQAETLDAEVTFPIATTLVTQQIEALVGAWDPARGQVVLIARDCDFGFARGRWFTLDRVDDSSVAAYLKGVVPITTRLATDESGIGGIFNVIPGLAVASSGALGSPIPVNRGKVWVRPGAISYVQLDPYSRPLDLTCSSVGAPAETPLNTSITWQGRLLSYQSGAPIGGASVTACPDLACASTVSSASSGSDGIVTLTLSTGTTGFGGYLRVDGPDVAPAIIEFRRPLVWSSFAPSTVKLLGADDFDFFASLAGVPYDATTGHVLGRLVDCLGTPLSGGSLESATGTVVYLHNGIPAPDATVGGPGGVALVIGAAPGEVLLHVERTDQPIGNALAAVEPGRVTYLVIPPGL